MPLFPLLMEDRLPLRTATTTNGLESTAAVIMGAAGGLDNVPQASSVPLHLSG